MHLEHAAKDVAADVCSADNCYYIATTEAVGELFQTGECDTGCPFEKHMVRIDEFTHCLGNIRFCHQDIVVHEFLAEIEGDCTRLDAAGGAVR